MPILGVGGIPIFKAWKVKGRSTREELNAQTSYTKITGSDDFRTALIMRFSE